jgi:hypothetical protein
MVDPLAWIATATAALGIWTLATGRPLRGLPRWPLSTPSLRLFGAYEAGTSLLVVVLAVTHNDGIAFLTYGVSAVAVFAAAQLSRRSNTSS